MTAIWRFRLGILVEILALAIGSPHSRPWLLTAGAGLGLGISGIIDPAMWRD